MLFNGSQKKRIYFDNAAATEIDPRVLKVINKTNKTTFANPGSIHKDGVRAFEYLESARRSVAKNLGALSHEIIFTSGATESNNLAILGLCEYFLKTGILLKDQHFISTSIEHPSIKEVLKSLKARGAKVDFLSVNKDGFFELKELKAKITKQTFLISLSYANSEIGTINDIKELMKTVRYFRKKNKSVFPLVHLDASQGFLLDLDVRKLGVDFLVLDGQKMYGPKGSGILFKKHGVNLNPVFYGGHQENGLRAGTENVSSAVGLAKALDLVMQNQQIEVEKITELRNFLFTEIRKIFSDMVLNGPELGENRLPGNLNLSLIGQSRELIVLRLDAKGISISAGSACQKSEESYILRSITDDRARISSAIRITLGRFNKKSECKRFVRELKQILEIK